LRIQKGDINVSILNITTLKTPIIFDGAMGTMLLSAGLSTGECPELWNITHGDIIKGIHRAYIEAGANVIGTNTFGANRIKLSHFGLEDKVSEINRLGVINAKKASGSKALTALSIGPTGQLLEPWGSLGFDDAVAIFKEQISGGLAGKPDMIIIETMTQLAEARAALLAAESLTRIPVITTMTFERNSRTTLGTDPAAAALVLRSMGADVVGVNCIGDLSQAAELIRRMAKAAGTPCIVQPNAGIPELVDGQAVYRITPEEFARGCMEIIKAGAGIVGGCCGTTPSHIRELSKAVQFASPARIAPGGFTAVTTNFDLIPLDPKGPVVVIGERINPTGKRALREQLKSGDFSGVVKEAKAQAEGGARILDVNMGIPGEDEPLLMRKAVMEIQKNVETGLCIDSSNITAMEEGLKAFHGRAVMNSVNGKAESLKTLLPLAKKYGALVIGLAMDERGIETTAEERFKIAEKIVRAAGEFGIPPADVIIDGLTLTAGAQQKYVMETIKTLRLVKERLGCLTTLGVSNVSYGVPQRPIVNRAFLAMALAAGLDLPIIDPDQAGLMETIAASELLTGRDDGGRKFIDTYKNATVETPILVKPQKQAGSLFDDILIGDVSTARKAAEVLLNQGTEPLDIINEYITPALKEVGKRYDAGQYFLPQLLLSAEAAQAAFSIIKYRLADSDIHVKGRVLLATVHGDIHDIGKNIVRVILENHGFSVTDLGKDVPPEAIIQALTPDIKLVGLSALMTTTVPAMEKTIKLLRDAGFSGKIMVGGAVLSPGLARRIGADFYARDAMEGVRIAQSVYEV
jgi:5-methyltetrahydrofolate--homocysteine methyltransferase